MQTIEYAGTVTMVTNSTTKFWFVHSCIFVNKDTTKDNNNNGSFLIPNAITYVSTVLPSKAPREEEG